MSSSANIELNISGNSIDRMDDLLKKTKQVAQEADRVKKQFEQINNKNSPSFNAKANSVIKSNNFGNYGEILNSISEFKGRINPKELLGVRNTIAAIKDKGLAAQRQELLGRIDPISVQAPRGIMRVAASQLNNLQLDADRDNKGVISDGMLSAIPKVTLKLNSDNLTDYAPVDEVVENAARTAEENGEFISERQMGEIFMSDKPTVDVVIKKSEKAAKASNRYRFKKQEKEAKEALAKLIEAELKKNERRISQMAKQIAADARKERRRVSVGEFNRGLRGAEESFFNAEKITEQREGFTVTMKSPKTNISKDVQEKSSAKPSKYAITDLVRQTYFLLMIETNTDVVRLIVKNENGKQTFALYNNEFDNYQGEELLKHVMSLKFMTLTDISIETAFTKKEIKESMDENMWGLF